MSQADDLLSHCEEFSKVLHSASSATASQWTAQHAEHALGWAAHVEGALSLLQPGDEHVVDSELEQLQRVGQQVPRREALALTVKVLRDARALLLRTLLYNRAVSPAALRTALVAGLDAPRTLEASQTGQQQQQQQGGSQGGASTASSQRSTGHPDAPRVKADPRISSLSACVLSRAAKLNSRIRLLTMIKEKSAAVDGGDAPTTSEGCVSDAPHQASATSHALAELLWQQLPPSATAGRPARATEDAAVVCSAASAAAHRYSELLEPDVVMEPTVFDAVCQLVYRFVTLRLCPPARTSAAAAHAPGAMGKGAAEEAAAVESAGTGAADEALAQGLPHESQLLRVSPSARIRQHQPYT